jgi:flavin reductase (DIM6/NTAB) family NADH-FMN oxidoreductase RutF
MADRDITKDVLRMFNYGLYVAAAQSPEGPRAATVSWVTQASFEPRLIAVAMRKGTAICEAARASRRFSLQVVAADQADFAKAFFKVTQAGPEEIAGYRFTTTAHGLPVFDAAAAWLECEVAEEANAAGDHAIFLCSILASGVREPARSPLALRDTPWHYGG